MIVAQEYEVKQVLLEELGFLSYAEKRKVHNVKYVDADIEVRM